MTARTPPLRWVSVDAQTGEVIAYLPRLAVDWPLSDTIGRSDATTASLPVRGAPRNWLAATEPRLVCLVALDPSNVDEAGKAAPVWGAWCYSRERTLGDSVALSLTTIPGYFERVFVRGANYAATGQNSIAADLVTRWARDGSVDASGAVLPGLPIEVRNLDGNAGTLRDRTFVDSKDTSLAAALAALSGLRGGPETVVRWEWRHGPERLVPVFEVGSRVGNRVTAGLGPAVTFSTATRFAGGGMFVSASYVEDWSSGKGATDVLAYASGTGDDRLTSSHVTGPRRRGPRVEFRWSPSSSITDKALLDSYAQAAWQLIGKGTAVLTMTLRRERIPAYGSRWRLGDDVGFRIEAPAFPQPLRGTARPIGVKVGETTIDLVLSVTDVPVADDDEGDS